MKRKTVLLIISLILFGCSNYKYSNEKIVKLSSGKSIEIYLEKKDLETGEKGLLVEYKNNEKVVKEKIIEKEVLEIWNAVEKDANESELNEGLIRYDFPVGKTKDTNEPVFETKFFSAEKIENGTWKIRKVN